MQRRWQIQRACRAPEGAISLERNCLSPTPSVPDFSCRIHPEHGRLPEREHPAGLAGSADRGKMRRWDASASHPIMGHLHRGALLDRGLAVAGYPGARRCRSGVPSTANPAASSIAGLQATRAHHDQRRQPHGRSRSFFMGIIIFQQCHAGITHGPGVDPTRMGPCRASNFRRFARHAISQGAETLGTINLYGKQTLIAGVVIVAVIAGMGPGCIRAQGQRRRRNRPLCWMDGNQTTADLRAVTLVNFWGHQLYHPRAEMPGDRQHPPK